MTPAELYDDIALRFPSLWPMMPEWQWVNIHDGREPTLEAISALLERHLGSSSVVVVVHSEPGTAVTLPIDTAPSYIAPYVLQHDVQVSDPLFERFVSISTTGVATADA
jgi:hypothetical protein